MVGILGGALGGGTIAIVIKAIDNYSKQFNKLDKSIKQQQTGFKKLTGFLKNTGIGYGILAGAAAGFAVDSVKGFLETERAAQVFNAVLGETADIMLTDLRRAARGMASDFALMDSANKALALGIDKNLLPELLEVARAKGKITGRTVTQAFDDISIGIGRQSRMILDNLGIILNLNQIWIEYEEETGIAADALSDYTKKQIIANKIIEEGSFQLKLMDAQIETHGEKLERAGALWRNLKDDIALALVSFGDGVVALGKIAVAYDVWTGNVKDPAVQESLNNTLKEIETISAELAEAVAISDSFRAELLGLSTGPFIDILKLEKEEAELRAALDAGVAAPGSAVRLAEVERELEGLRNKKDVLEKTVELIAAEEDANKKTVDSALNDVPRLTAAYKDSLVNVEAISLKLKGVEKTNKIVVDAITSDWQTFFNFLENSRDTIRSTLSPFISKGVFDKTAIFPFQGFENRLFNRNENLISSRGGNTGVTLNVEGSLIGLDENALSRALSDELNNKLSI